LVRVAELPTAWDPFVSAHFAPFAEPAATAPADLTVRCREAAGTVLPLPPPGGETSLELARTEGGRYTIRSHWQDGWIDTQTGEADLVLTSRAEIPFRMSVENFLRAASQLMLLERDAFLLHSAAVLDRGHAFLLFGPSGAGKSTATRNSAPRPALSDDIVLVEVSPGARPVAVAVPFFGVFPKSERQRGRWPIAAALRLRQDPRDVLEPLSPARAVASVSASVPFVHEPGQPHEQLTALVARLCSRVPAYDLRLRDSPRFWELLERLAPDGSV
jgi:hypothetical protein